MDMPPKAKHLRRDLMLKPLVQRRRHNHHRQAQRNRHDGNADDQSRKVFLPRKGYFLRYEKWKIHTTAR